MEKIELFDIGLYYTILGNVMLSPEERNSLSLLYHSYLEDKENFTMSEKEQKELLHIYKIAVEVLLTNANYLQKIITCFEKSE